MDKNETTRVRYQELRPQELAARRNELPLAYLPLGILEWHGLHNPLGLDGVKAEAVCERLAQKLGGVAMPALFWGDHRGDICELVFDPEVAPWLPEGTQDHTKDIERLSGISKQALAADAERSEKAGGWRLWKELFVRMLFETQALGFEAAVVLPGHYPLFTPVKEALGDYRDQGGALDVLTLTDHMAADEGKSGDHAAAFETSIMLALRPDLVDLAQLDPQPDKKPVGVLGEDPRIAASEEYGLRIMSRFENIVRQWLRNVTNLANDR